MGYITSGDGRSFFLLLVENSMGLFYLESRKNIPGMIAKKLQV